MAQSFMPDFTQIDARTISISSADEGLAFWRTTFYAILADMATDAARLIQGFSVSPASYRSYNMATYSIVEVHN